jgi:hypothetical protein
MAKLEDGSIDLQRTIDAQQHVLDLEGVISRLQQRRVDREQLLIDGAQGELNQALAQVSRAGHYGIRADLASRQDKLSLRQRQGDAHQAQVDESTIALEIRQAMLDGRQSEKDRAVARHL